MNNPILQEAPRYVGSTPSRKALLLRVGIDKGTSGALGPIFRDGTFEYIPIPESVPTRGSLTYATLAGRHVASLAAVLPARLAQRHPHVDPDFRTLTYGDTTLPKRQQLLRLIPGDLFVFYAGLVPFPTDDRSRLFAVASFQVQAVYHLFSNDLHSHNLDRRFGRTAHFLRQKADQDLALVEGTRQESGLFARAVPLADGRDRLLRDLSALGYQGSLLRSVGHWITETAELQFLEGWLSEGPTSLVGGDTRLISIAPSALRFARDSRDLVILDPRPREGDWVISMADNEKKALYAFGRVNHITTKAGPRRAYSSLYWRFEENAEFPAAMLQQISDSRNLIDSAAIRRLTTWFSNHYRIGSHHTQ